MSGFIKSFIGTAGFSVVCKITAVVLGIVLARVLGAEEYGKYSYLISVISLACIPVTSGLPTLIIREIASYLSAMRYDYIKGMLNWSFLYIILMSILSALLLYIFSSELSLSGDGVENYILLIFIPLKGFLYRYSSVFNGFKMPVLSQLPLGFFPPLIMLSIVGCIYFNENTVDHHDIIFVNLVSMLATISFVYIIYRILIKVDTKTVLYESDKWKSSLLPLSFITIIGTLNLELVTIFIGKYSNPIELANFRVSLQAVSLIALGLVAINMVAKPTISSLYSQNKKTDIQNLVTKCARLGAMVSLPVIISIVFFGKELLSVLFGDEYLNAYPILLILTLSQFFNIMTGPVGLVLSMVGKEKKMSKTLALVLVINIILLMVLTPLYGAIGGAIAVLFCEIIYSLSLVLILYRETKIKSWVR